MPSDEGSVPQHEELGQGSEATEDAGDGEILFPSISFAAYAADGERPVSISILETLKLAEGRPGQTEPVDNGLPVMHRIHSNRKVTEGEIRNYYEGVTIHMKRLGSADKHRISSCGAVPRKGFLSFESFQAALKAGCSPCAKCLVVYISITSPTGSTSTP